MDPVEDQDLLYIAKLGLIEPVPDPWQVLKDEEDNIIYFNPETQEQCSQHPSDEKFREWYL